MNEGSTDGQDEGSSRGPGHGADRRSDEGLEPTEAGRARRKVGRTGKAMQDSFFQNSLGAFVPGGVFSLKESDTGPWASLA